MNVARAGEDGPVDTMPLPPDSQSAADAPTEQVHRDQHNDHEVRSAFGGVGRAIGHKIEDLFGGPARTRVIVILGGVLALSSADTATVGASATPLRHAL